MSIVLLHSLWYLLNFLWGLLKPKHFNFKIKHYYSRARKKGNCVLFRSISSESTVSWCVLPSQCCVLQSQLLCTEKLADVHCSDLVYCRPQGQLMCTAESVNVNSKDNWYVFQSQLLRTEDSAGVLKFLQSQTQNILLESHCTVYL